MGFRRLYIEGDSFCVIVFRWEIVNLWSISNIIRDTRMFLRNCGVINMNYIFKEENRAVDWIVNEGYKIYYNFN